MRLITCFLALLTAASAAGQPSPIYDPDDFVDPRRHDQPIFISRLALAGVRSFIDDYRVLGRNAGFLHLTNTLYYERAQFDYKHTEAYADNPPLFRCDCQPPIYLPTPAPPNAAPKPISGSKDTLQVGWYREVSPGPAEPSYVLRSRLSFSRERFDTPLHSLTTGEVVDHRSGHEQSVRLDTDTRWSVAGHDLWGSLTYGRTWSSGTVSNRMQQDFLYTARPHGFAMGQVLAHATLTVGGITNRGGTAINAVNPAVEAYWRHSATQVNVHLIWSPQTTRDGEHGWRTHSQVALVVDRALLVHVFR